VLQQAKDEAERREHDLSEAERSVRADANGPLPTSKAADRGDEAKPTASSSAQASAGTTASKMVDPDDKNKEEDLPELQEAIHDFKLKPEGDS